MNNKLNTDILAKAKKGGNMTKSYVKNAGSSMAHVAWKVVGNTMPDLFSFGEQNADLVKDVLRGIKDPKKVLNDFGSYIDESAILTEVKDIAKNAIDDIKTGKLYDPTRDRTGDYGYNDDLLGNFGGFDFSDIDDSGDYQEGSSGISADGDEISGAIERTSSMERAESAIQTGATIKAIGLSSDAVIRSNAANSKMSIASSLKQHSQVMIGLGNVSVVMGSIDTFNKTVMVGHFNQVSEANSKMVGKLTNIDSTLTEIRDLLKGQYGQVNKNKRDPYDISEYNKRNPIENGTFDIKKYFGNVMKNIDNEWNVSSQLSIMGGGMNSKDFLKLFKSNPLEGVLVGGMTAMLPRLTLKIADDFNKTFSGFFSALMLKFNRKGEDNDLFRLLGVKPETRTGIRMDYNLGPTPFDAQTKIAITEVIPNYLARIESALTGKGERVYDYKARKFANPMRQITNSMNAMNDMSGNMYNTMARMNEMMDNFTFESYDQQKNTKNNMKKLFNHAIKTGRGIDPYKDKYLQNSINLEGGEKAFNMLMGMIRQMSRQDIMNMNKEMYGAQFRMNTAWQDTNRDLDERGMKTALFGSGNKDFEEVASMASTGVYLEDSEFAKYDKSAKDISLGGAIMDIRSMLRRGILTYSLNIKDADNPDKLLKKFKGTGMRPDKVINLALDEFKTIADTSNRSDKDETYRRNMNESYAKRYAEAQMRGDGKTLLIGDNHEFGEYDRQFSKRILNENYAREGRQKDYEIDNAMVAKALDKLGIKSRVSSIAGKLDNRLNPFRYMNVALQSMDRKMFTMIYGKEAAGDFEGTEDGFDGDNLIDSVTKLVNRQMKMFGTKIDKHILAPLENKLFGENGILDKLSGYMGKKFTPIKDRMSGYATEKFNSAIDLFVGKKTGRVQTYKDKDGKTKTRTAYSREGGIFSDTLNAGADFLQPIKDQFVDYSKSVIQFSKDILFGDPSKRKDPLDKGKGLMTGWFTGMKKGLSSFLFGDDYIDEKTGETKQTESRQMWNKVKGEFKGFLPKGAAAFGLGAVGTLGGGLLTGLFLPGGPIMGGILASFGSFISHSEKFREYMFGNDEKGKEGVIKKEYVDAVKRFAPKMAGGAAIGAMITNFGLFGTSILPGGPLMGAFLGGIGGMITGSKSIKKAIFGESVDDEGHFTPAFKKDMMKNIAAVAPGIGIGVLAGGAIGHFGLLGMLGVPGGPIFGALGGIAAALNKDTIKTFLFGGEDKDGKEKDGIFSRMIKFGKKEIFDPFADGVNKIGANVKDWFQTSIVDSLTESMGPMREAIAESKKHIKDGLKGFGSMVGKSLNNVFEKSFGKPIEEVMKKYVTDPLKEIAGKIVGAVGKVLGGIISMPFKAINHMAKDYTKKKDKKNAAGAFMNALFNPNMSPGDKSKAGEEGLMGVLGIIGGGFGEAGSRFGAGLDKIRTSWALSKEERMKQRNAEKMQREQEKINKAREKQARYDEKSKAWAEANAQWEMSGGIGGWFGRTVGMIDKEGVYKNRRTRRNAEKAEQEKLEAIKKRDEKIKIKLQARQSKKDDKNRKKQEDTENDNKKWENEQTSNLGKKNAKELLVRIANDVRVVKKEISGQLDGVGYNLEHIKNILMWHLKPPIDTAPSGLFGKRGNKSKRGLIGRLLGSAGDKIGEGWEWVKGKVSKVGKAIASPFVAFGNMMGEVYRGMKALGGVIGETVKFGLELVKETLPLLISGLRGVVEIGAEVIKDGIGLLGDGLRGVVTTIGSFASGLADSLGRAFGAVVETLGNVTSALSSFGKMVFDIGSVLIPNIIGGIFNAGKFIGKGILGGVGAAGSFIGGGISKLFGRGDGEGKGKMLGIVKIAGGWLDSVHEVKKFGWGDSKFGNINTLNLVDVVDGKSVGLSPKRAVPVYIAGSYENSWFGKANNGAVSSIDTSGLVVPNNADPSTVGGKVGYTKSNLPARARTKEFKDISKSIDKTFKAVTAKGANVSQKYTVRVKGIKDANDLAVLNTTALMQSADATDALKDAIGAGGGGKGFTGGKGTSILMDLFGLLPGLFGSLFSFLRGDNGMLFKNIVKMTPLKYIAAPIFKLIGKSLVPKGIRNFLGDRFGKVTEKTVADVSKEMAERRLEKLGLSKFEKKALTTLTEKRIAETGFRASGSALLSSVERGLKLGATGAVDALKVAKANPTVVQKIMAFIQKFLKDSRIAKFVAKTPVGKFMGPLKKAIEEGCAKASEKTMAKILFKATGGAATTIGFAVYDFTSGMSEAGNIFEINSANATWGMRFSAGMAKMISGLMFGILSDRFIADIILKASGSDLEKAQMDKARTEYSQEVAAYNKANGTDYSVDEYSDKVGNKRFASKVWDGVKKAPGAIFGWATDSIASGIGATAKVASSVLDLVFNNSKSPFFDRFSNVILNANYGILSTLQVIFKPLAPLMIGMAKFFGVKPDGQGAVEKNIVAGQKALPTMTDQQKMNYYMKNARGKAGFGDAGSSSTNQFFGLTHYSQNDSRWAGTRFGSETIGTAGCSPTAASIILSNYNQKKPMTPSEAAKFAFDNNFKTGGAGTDPAFFTAIGKSRGISIIPGSKNIAAVRDQLLANRPIIVTGKRTGMNSPYSSYTPHTMTVMGYDQETGMAVVLDPNSNEPKYATLENILKDTTMVMFTAGPGMTGMQAKYIPPKKSQTPSDTTYNQVTTRSGPIARNVKDFIGKIASGAVAGFSTFGILPSITMAQAILESGAGKSAIGNNIFGIKAPKWWTGLKQLISSGEYENGRKVMKKSWFKDYSSIDESILDHAKLLNRSRYAGVKKASNYREAAIAVQKAGYATDPQYSNKLINIIEKYGLGQYDSGVFGKGNKGNMDGSDYSYKVKAPTYSNKNMGYVHYLQNDPAYGSKKYGDDDTLASAGCAPTVAADLIRHYYPKAAIDPVIAANFAQDHKFKLNKNGTDPAFFTAIGRKYGVEVYQGVTNFNTINIYLSKHQPVILMGKGNPTGYERIDGGWVKVEKGNSAFGYSMHYVLVIGYDKSRDIYQVLNPLMPNVMYINGKVLMAQTMKVLYTNKTGVSAKTGTAGSNYNAEKMKDKIATTKLDNYLKGGVDSSYVDNSATNTTASAGMFGFFDRLGTLFGSISDLKHGTKSLKDVKDSIFGTPTSGIGYDKSKNTYNPEITKSDGSNKYDPASYPAAKLIQQYGELRSKAYNTRQSGNMLTGAEASELNPILGERLNQLAKAKKKMLSITSGSRTLTEQIASYKKDSTLAWDPKKGVSRHMLGLAADVGDWGPSITDKEYAQYGLYKAAKEAGLKEEWHIEPIETRGKSPDTLYKTYGSMIDFGRGKGNTNRKLASMKLATNSLKHVNTSIISSKRSASNDLIAANMEKLRSITTSSMSAANNGSLDMNTLLHMMVQQNSATIELMKAMNENLSQISENTSRPAVIAGGNPINPGGSNLNKSTNLSTGTKVVGTLNTK